MHCQPSAGLLGSHPPAHTAPPCSLPPRSLCLPSSRQHLQARKRAPGTTTATAATLRREHEEQERDPAHLQGLQFASHLSSTPAAAASSSPDSSHVATLGARMVLERLYSGGLASSSGRVASSTDGADRVRAWQQQQQQPILCLPQVLEQQQTVTQEAEQQQQQQRTPSEQGYRGGGGGRDPRDNPVRVCVCVLMLCVEACWMLFQLVCALCV